MSFVAVPGVLSALTVALPKFGALVSIDAGSVATIDAALTAFDWTYLVIRHNSLIEIVKVLSVESGKLVVVRAQSGTDRTLFPVGATVSYEPVYSGVVDQVQNTVSQLDITSITTYGTNFPIVTQEGRNFTLNFPMPPFFSQTPIELVGNEDGVGVGEVTEAGDTPCGVPFDIPPPPPPAPTPTPWPDPPPITELIWWSAGDGVIHKSPDSGAYVREYLTDGANTGQNLIVDSARNRVFVPTQSGLYIIEGATVNGDIPEPTLLEDIPWIGTYGSWTLNNAIRLDPATGQLFMANATNDSVSIINTDNTFITLEDFDNVFLIWALGDGKFCVADDFATHLEVWGPSNDYAEPLLDKVVPDSDTILSSAYDASTGRMICYLETQTEGLWIVDVDTGVETFTPIDGHEGTVMYFVPELGVVVLSQNSDNGKLYVYYPYTGALVATIDYTGTVVGGTLSGAALDFKHIDQELCILQRWIVAGQQRAALHIANLVSGTVGFTYLVPNVSGPLGLPANIGMDYEWGLFTVGDTDVDTLFQVYYQAPYYVFEIYQYDVGTNFVAGGRQPIE